VRSAHAFFCIHFRAYCHLGAIRDLFFWDPACRRERTRQYEKLNAAERITLKSSQVLLGNKYARTILFFYVLIMHLLVFATLWHFSHVSHRDCDHGGEGGLVGGLAVRSSGPPGLSRLIPTGLRLPAGGADGVGDPALAVS